MPALPNSRIPIADSGGFITDAWQSFLQKLAGDGAAPDKPIQAGPSPFAYTAPANGHLVIQGTATGLSLIRGRNPIALPPGLGLVPMSKGDQVLVTYSSAPGLVWLPA